MKNAARQQRISLALLLSAVVFCMAFLADNPIKDIQHAFIFHNFLDSEKDALSLKTFRYKQVAGAQDSFRKYNPYFYPDSTTIFSNEKDFGKSISQSNGRFIIRTIESSFYASPGYVYTYTRDIFGATYPSEDFIQKCKQQFGLSPISKTLITANKTPWYFWSGEAVEKIFHKYYGKPDNAFQQVTYGFIYKVAAKNYMQDYVSLLNHLLVTKKDQWMQVCKTYQQNALTNSKFDGAYASAEAVEVLITEKEKEQFKVIETNYLYLPVGELIRRQIDGSLPSILKCIRIILQDYDPELLRLLKA